MEGEWGVSWRSRPECCRVLVRRCGGGSRSKVESRLCGVEQREPSSVEIPGGSPPLPPPLQSLHFSESEKLGAVTIEGFASGRQPGSGRGMLIVLSKSGEDYTTSTFLTKPLPSLWSCCSTLCLSITTLAFPSPSTGAAGKPSPTLKGRAPSTEGCQIPPMVDEPSGEYKRRKLEGKRRCRVVKRDKISLLNSVNEQSEL